MPLRAFLVGLLPRMGAECIGGEIPTAEKRRPTHSAFSVCCDTQVEGRCCILGNNVLRASDVPFSKLVVEVDSGYFRMGDEQKACSLGRSRASQRGGAMPLRAFLGGLLPRMGAECTEYKAPMVGETASDSLGLLRILRYASRGP